MEQNRPDLQSEQLPGPAALFVSGFPGNLDTALLPVIRECGCTDLQIIYCTPGMVSATLESALTESFDEEMVPQDKLPPVMVFSGISMDQVQFIISSYSNTGLPRPIFATTTVHNLSFTVKELIMHLLEERRQQLEGK